MADLYADYAALAAAEVEGVDYQRVTDTPQGTWWAAIAIHGGLIEPGTGPVARQLATARRTAFYEFKGLRAGSQPDLHITSTNFDEPQCEALVGAVGRVLSLHGCTGTVGVPETLVGGLDVGLRDSVISALQAAGFTASVATSLTGTDPANISNKTATRAGVQLEMSRALRESFFPAGDLSLAALDDPTARTSAFDAYCAAVAAAVTLTLTCDTQLSRVRLTGAAPGVADDFGRIVVDGWGESTSGHMWLTGGASSAFQVTGTVGQHIHTAVNVSRWCLTGWASDADVTAEVATDALAAGGGHFCAVVARAADDGATCYLARLEYEETQNVILTLRKRVAGTETFLVQHTLVGEVHQPGVAYAVRLQAIGSTLRGKAWPAATAEPDGWDLETTDTDVAGPGRVGVRSILSAANTNPLPVVVAWDNIRTRGKTSVERSTTGMRWETVRGGSGLDGTASALIRLDDYEFPAVAVQYRLRVVEPVSGATLWVDQDSVTPILDGVWLKSIARPFLNRRISISTAGNGTYGARTGIFDIVGRSSPIAVSDVRSSDEWQLIVRTPDTATRRDLKLLLASGDTLLIHVPSGWDVPGGYVAVGEATERRFGPVNPLRHWVLPCRRVAAPGPDIIGSTVTWQHVTNTYLTWANAMAAHPTWADLLEIIGDPEDVIVP